MSEFMSSGFVSSEGLGRFLVAQNRQYADIEAELTAGLKQTHWMWFAFPQQQGLGHSAMSRRYALGPSEVRSYYDHRVLGVRLVAWTGLVTGWLERGRRVRQIFPSPVDQLKFRSCMKLFDGEVGRHDPCFARALWTDIVLEYDQGDDE